MLFYIFRKIISACLAIFFSSQLVLSWVCDEESVLKKSFGKSVRSDNSTLSNNGSLNESLHKNSSFKRNGIALGNPFVNGKCKGFCEKYFHRDTPPTLIAADGFFKFHIQHICQIYKNEERFASVFNRYFSLRVPVAKPQNVQVVAYPSTLSPEAINKDNACHHVPHAHHRAH